MAFLIGGANTLRDTGYEISNSLRFSADTDLKRLPSATGQSVKGTLSVWVKFAKVDTAMAIIGGFDNSGAKDNDGYFVFQRTADGNLQFEGGDNVYLETTALFRDVTAWYHIVLAIDSGNSTAAQKQRIYVNGVEITAFDTRNNLTNLQDLPMNTTAGNDDALLIGCDEDPDGKGLFFEGYMSEFYWIDQNQYAASDFGEYDGDSGIWIPKNAKGDLTFGDNGFYLEFKGTGTSQNSSGMGADTSGEDNHLAVNNLTAIDVTIDTPTNNFCTLNPLAAEAGFTFSEGNTTSASSTDNTTHGSTFAVSKGKWYWEMVGATHQDNFGSGIVDVDDYIRNIGYESVDSYYFNSNGDKITGSSVTSLFGNLSNEGHLMYALDLDNGNFSFGFEGTWSNGSATQSTTFNTSNFDFTSIPDHYYYIGRAQQTGSATTARFNFGNPPLSAMGNGHSDDNGYGNFKTAVPSGYYALCTKNLAEYG